jgi:hypothetical protein
VAVGVALNSEQLMPRSPGKIFHVNWYIMACCFNSANLS